LKLAGLRRAGRTPQLPLTVQLPQGDLVVQRWLRVLPNRRYVGVAEWRGRKVLAKLLVGGKAWRHYRRERDGARLLATQGLDTPLLLADGFQLDAGGWLLFDYLEDAQSLEQRWRGVASQPPLSDAQDEILKDALRTLGKMHIKGLWQDDLHLDNLLYWQGRLYWVDGGSVQCGAPAQPLPQKLTLANLGMFFAQLPVKLDSHLDVLLDYYRHGNPDVVLSLPELHRQITKLRRWRLAGFMAKTGRECTFFSVRRGAMGLEIVRRDTSALLAPLLDAPDQFVEKGTVLKGGDSTTVAKILVNGRDLVVKRYNIKNFRHWLRRLWRPSRGWHSWREANRLVFLGIATARPLALVERRILWLRRGAYLVTDYLTGENVRIRFAPYVNSAPPEAELSALEHLFSAMVRERISHGDLKGTNLIWHDGEWALIDLDAVRQHRCNLTFARAYARDRARFLRNWPEDSALHRLLDQRLPQVPGTCGLQRG